MPEEWAAVENLMRELGAVRAAAAAAHADEIAHRAIETAIAEATGAVIETLSHPQDHQALAQAQDAIEVVADVLFAFDAELVRSRRIRARGMELRQRARELIEQARRKRIRDV